MTRHPPVFTVTPGAGPEGPMQITWPEEAAESGVRREVFHFPIPPRMHFEFNPGDRAQEVLFLPYGGTCGERRAGKEPRIVKGIVEVFLESFTGAHRLRIYSEHTKYLTPAANITSNIHRRHWKHYAIGASGDRIIVAFTPLERRKCGCFRKVHIDPEKTILALTVSRITRSKKKRKSKKRQAKKKRSGRK